MSGGMTARGVVVTEPGAAAVLVDIELDPPGPGEVLVRILASGVCHSDLHAKLGHMGKSFPYLLGHEATAVVERVGQGVERPAVGDTVMLSWRAPCGHCSFCAAGRPSHCKRPVTAPDRMRIAGGAVLNGVLGLGTFATHSVVAAGQCIVTDAALPATSTCLVGCCVVTGVGAALFAAGVQPGQTVAVFGCGAVGVSVVQGARIARARRIIAVDRVPQKLAWARELGATDVIDASQIDPVKAIRDMTGGVDHAFEAVGLPETLAQAVQSCGLAGSATLIGVPHPKAVVSLSLAQLFYGRITLRSTFYGDCLPSRDFPLLADWYRAGVLDLDRLVTRTIDLDGVEEAFSAMQRGETLRSVIVMPSA